MTDGRNKAVIILISLIILLVVLFGWHVIHRQLLAREIASTSNNAVVVELTTVQSQEWHPQIQAVGTIIAHQGIMITTQVAGIVDTINFQSGDFIEQGTVLLQLDKRALQAAADQSEAKFQIANEDYQRQQQLYKTRVISISMLQTSKATMMAAKAQWDADKANLDNTTIRAPFSGNLGLRQINMGQYLAIGAPIVSLQAVDPVFVDFTVAEIYLPQVAKGDAITLTTSAYPGQIFNGKIIALNSMLDADTRTLSIRAEVPNPNKLLMPGMFAQVNVLSPTKSNVLTVPQTAIQYSPFGDTVFIVQNHRAVQRYITLGEQRGPDVAVLSGLSANETIVAVGANKLQNGAEVVTKEGFAAEQKARAETRVEKDTNTKKILVAKPTEGNGK